MVCVHHWDRTWRKSSSKDLKRKILIWKTEESKIDPNRESINIRLKQLGNLLRDKMLNKSTAKIVSSTRILLVIFSLWWAVFFSEANEFKILFLTRCVEISGFISMRILNIFESESGDKVTIFRLFWMWKNWKRIEDRKRTERIKDHFSIKL